MRDREVETTYVISAPDRSAVADAIASLSELGGYRLLPRGAEKIEDLYLDDGAGHLRARRLAFRLRRTGGAWLIALKRSAEDEIVDDRVEIERPWSAASLAEIERELEENGIVLPEEPLEANSAPPRDVLRRLGFEVIQHRETHRRPREVLDADETSGTVLAELAVDAVVYHLRSRDVRHHEVEIEAKADEGVALLEPLAQALLAQYGRALRPWRHGKLATGMAIEELLRTGAVEALVLEGDTLAPAAYDRIDELLTARAG